MVSADRNALELEVRPDPTDGQLMSSSTHS